MSEENMQKLKEYQRKYREAKKCLCRIIKKNSFLIII